MTQQIDLAAIMKQVDTDEMKDVIPLGFGKYKGQTPEEIADEDPSYIVWLYDTINPKVCSESIALYCEWEVRETEGDR